MLTTKTPLHIVSVSELLPMPMPKSRLIISILFLTICQTQFIYSPSTHSRNVYFFSFGFTTLFSFNYSSKCWDAYVTHVNGLIALAKLFDSGLESDDDDCCNGNAVLARRWLHLTLKWIRLRRCFRMRQYVNVGQV